MDNKSYVDEVRIRCVSKNINDQIANIADHKGVTKTAFLKSELHSIVEKYPQHMRAPFDKG
jgi:hypothetical protein